MTADTLKALLLSLDVPFTEDKGVRAWTFKYQSTQTYTAQGLPGIRITAEMTTVFNKDGTLRRVEFIGTPVGESP